MRKKTSHRPDDTRRPRLKKQTLRTLSTDEAAQVRGGVFIVPPKKAYTHSPNDTRYCLNVDET